MKTYRAAHTEDVFVGAHFAEEREEAAAYADNELAGTGENHGGDIYCYEVDGEVLEVENSRDLAEECVRIIMDAIDFDEIREQAECPVEYAEMVEDAMYEAGDFFADKVLDVVRIDELNGLSASEIVRRLDLQRRGIEYAFSLIEEFGADEILDASDYAWVVFKEPSVGRYQHRVCTTWRYLGGGIVDLVD